MRMYPAHLREAKQWARALHEALHKFNVQLDHNDPKSPLPSLQQTQELMAKAMGYSGGWREVATLTQQPHVPVYLPPEEESRASFHEAHDRLASALGTQLGMTVVNGHLHKAIDVAGIGHSAKKRRAILDKTTRWGIVQEEWPVAQGIRAVSTYSHGGWILSPERQAAMPEHLRNPDAEYEEDGEFYLVVIAFPDDPELKRFSQRDALAHLEIVDRAPSRVRTPAAEHSTAQTESGHKSTHTMAEPNPASTDLSAKVIDYLGDCVRSNRIPIRFPREASSKVREVTFHARAHLHHKLSEWIDLYSTMPTSNGSWATREGPWYDHWDMYVRLDQKDEADDINLGALMETLSTQR